MIAQKENLLDILSKVMDPDIPIVNIVELGIVRSVELKGDVVSVIITPTYSGCPAMVVMGDEIKKVFAEEGINNVEIKTVLSPAWTTDWITPEAKQKMKEHGIAPPDKTPEDSIFSILEPIREPQCPYCNSNDTVKQAEFGSTACKSLHFCNECRQPFEHFKCI